MKLNIGNVIKITGSLTPLVVIETNLEISKELYAEHFTTISKEDFDNGKENPKEKVWTLKDLSTMHGSNEIRSHKVEIIDQVSISKKTTTVYKPK